MTSNNKQQATLCKAARTADLPLLTELLQNGADPNIGNEKGVVPLWHAFGSKEENDACVRLLLQHGADIYLRDQWGHPPLAALFHIAEERLCNILQGFDVNRLDAKGCNILHYACFTGHGDMVRALLRLGADTACRTASGDLPLEIALARAGDEDASFLHDEVADMLRPVSPAPRQPLPRRLGYELTCAAQKGDKAAMHRLLAEGAPVNGDDWGILSPNGLHDTPILALPLAKYENDALTQEDFAEMTRMLVDAGADLDFSDDDFNTPLHKAVYYNLPGMVRVLLEAGADTTAVSDFGGTPLQIAEKKRTPETRILLETWIQNQGL